MAVTMTDSDEGNLHGGQDSGSISGHHLIMEGKVVGYTDTHILISRNKQIIWLVSQGPERSTFEKLETKLSGRQVCDSNCGSGYKPCSSLCLEFTPISDHSPVKSLNNQVDRMIHPVDSSQCLFSAS